MEKFVQRFALWIVLGCALGLAYPPAVTWFLKYDLITVGLQIIMLGMGLTLRLEDFARIAQRPAPVTTGVVLQYAIMPFMGWSMSTLYALPTPYAVGLILVCCCPGGTASNLITYLAKADVALSVTMTSVTTLMAAFMTPMLTLWLAGSRVHVSAWGLFADTLSVILVPVIVGVLLQRFAPRITARILPFAPPAAVLMIVLIVASILAAQRETLRDTGLRIVLAVFSAHAGGFLLGKVLSGLVEKDERATRAISIEVGMQNSGLGAVLARNNFADPLTAIPSAISAVMHCLIGSALAAYWARKSK